MSISFWLLIHEPSKSLKIMSPSSSCDMSDNISLNGILIYTLCIVTKYEEVFDYLEIMCTAEHRSITLGDFKIPHYHGQLLPLTSAYLIQFPNVSGLSQNIFFNINSGSGVDVKICKIYCSTNSVIGGRGHPSFLLAGDFDLT